MIMIPITLIITISSPERGRPTRGRDVSLRGPNLLQQSTSHPLSSRGGPQIRPCFLWSASTKTWTGGKGLSCFLQEMWKATWDPCSTVLYVHIKSLHIKPPSNAIIPPLTGFTSNAHTSNSNPTHLHSCHTHQISTSKTFPHIHNLTKNPPHTSTNQPTPPLTTPNNINLMQLNINSITKKTTELTHLIHKQKIHIITLQESNLNSKHKTPNIPNFSAIRLDVLSFQKGGGLLTFINNNITFLQIPIPTNLITNNIELITTKIHLKHTNLHISNVYIPPNTNNIDNSINNLFIHLTSFPNSIITGDFNAHSQTWHSLFTDHRGQLITSLILNSNHIILNQNTPI